MSQLGAFCPLCPSLCPLSVSLPPPSSTVWLSTAPTEPLTQWYQVRCLLQTPLFAKLGQTLSGTVLMTTNQR